MLLEILGINYSLHSVISLHSRNLVRDGDRVTTSATAFMNLVGM